MSGHEPVSLVTLLRREQDRLDRLIAEVDGGIASQGHYDLLEEQGSLVSVGVRDAFRKGARG